jgi:hypothetical protein
MSAKTLPPEVSGGTQPVGDERPGGGASAAPQYTRTEEGQVRPLDGEEYLRRLRTEFPHVGFVADIGSGVWIAVQGRSLLIRADSAIELRERLLAAFGRR